MRFVEVVYEEKLVIMLQTPLSSCAQNYRLLWGGVGGHSALRGTVCPRVDCPGGHPALGQTVLGGIWRGGQPALLHRFASYEVHIGHFFLQYQCCC